MPLYVTTIKPFLARAISLTALILLSPVYAIIALAIVIDDPGPIFFSQKRYGKDNVFFMCHKFRTMKMSAPHDVPTHKLKNPEQYITRVGKILRKTSLDELPQFWDVFQQNMVIVGPRPALWNQDNLIAEMQLAWFRTGLESLDAPQDHAFIAVIDELAMRLVSDSGTLPEESSYYTSIDHPFPAVCIRTSTERPEALDKACFILSGISTEGLLQSVDLAVSMNENGDYGIPVPDYIDTNVSTKVVKIIQSYKDTVNRFVWRKDI